MIEPTRDRTRRAGLALAAALLLALPVLAAPTPPAPATETAVEAASEGWSGAFAGLWERLLAFAGVPTQPSEPAAPQPTDDEATQLSAFDDQSESRPSLDPNGVR